MNKQELIDALAADTDLTKTDVSRVLDALGEITAKTIKKKGGEVTLPGIGKLKTAKRAGREGRNPKTGESIQIPARTAVKFSAAKALKDAVA